MSLLATYATELACFPHDPNYTFAGHAANEAPCFYCITQAHRDPALLCVVDDKPKTCILCDRDHKGCGAIPLELLGTAQAYWTAVEDLQQRYNDSDGNWSRRQVGRAATALVDCGSAWNSILKRLTKPAPSAPARATLKDEMMLQELASSRQLLTLLLLQSAGAELSLSEIQSRVTVAAPPYASDGSPARTLKEAILRLNNCENTSRPGEVSADELAPGISADFSRLLSSCHDNPAPDCTVSYAGKPPVRNTRKRTAPGPAPGGRSSQRRRVANGGGDSSSGGSSDGN